MAVSKRVRFEVLRRDEHTCQYCGGRAPDVVLHIDHVIPVSLGGEDKPGNLVAACKDCNSGKSSIAPDSPLVQSVSDQAAAYVLGMQDKLTRFRGQVESFSDYLYEFTEAWSAWSAPSGELRALPDDYELSLFRWHSMGIPVRAITLAIPKAMVKRGVRGDNPEFTYMAGIVWNMFNDLQIDYTTTDQTCAVYTSGEAEEFAASEYSAGHKAGYSRGAGDLLGALESRDFVGHHIDGTTSSFTRNFGALIG